MIATDLHKDGAERVEVASQFRLQTAVVDLLREAVLW
jgi:hypothetical protein